MNVLRRKSWSLYAVGALIGLLSWFSFASVDKALGITRIRASGGNMLLFAHREILRVLAMRWIGLAPMEGRRLLLATASLSVLGYDHDLAEPVIHAWNDRGATSSSQGAR